MGVIHLYILLTLISFVINFGFGVVTLTIDHKNQLNRTFAILVFMLSWWALMKLCITLSPTQDWAFFFYNLSGLGWCLLPAYYANLTYSIIRKRNLGYRRYVAYVLSFLFLGFYVCLWIPGLMTRQMVIEDWGYTDVPGWMFSNVFQPVFLATFVYIIVELAVFAGMARRRDDRMKSLLVLVGLLVPLIGGAVTNMILPSFGIYVFELAVPLTTVNAAIVAYAMVRYRLMGFRVDYISRSIIDVTAETLLVINEHGRIGMASQASQDLLGYGREELVGMHINEVLYERKFLEEMRDELDRKGSMMMPSRFVSRDGETIPVNLTAKVLQSERGRFVGYVIVGSRLFTTDRPTRVSLYTPPSDEKDGDPGTGRGPEHEDGSQED